MAVYRTTAFAAAVMAIGLMFSNATLAAGSRGVEVKVRTSESADAPVADTVQLYGASHALVIGIDKYTMGWPRLSKAVEDARAVAQELERQGFQVSLKTDLNANALRTTLREFFAIKGADPNARLLLWYAGHGHSIGGEGFLVPADAPPDTSPAFLVSALPMRDFGSMVRLAQSKHVLSVFDSCFSGTIFQARAGATPRAITKKTTKPVRQFITSGDEGQQVRDDGSFREYFIRALKGEEKGDFNGDGYMTGEELGLFLNQKMAALTSAAQTPKSGKLHDVKFNQGDFVFVLPSVDAASRSGGGTGSVEVVFWQSIQTSRNPATFKAYLSQYPSGAFAALARVKIEELKGTKTTSLTPPATPAGPTKSDIRATQQLLTGMGYSPGVADGVMGGRTRVAIERFQLSHGLMVTGRIDGDLLAALRGARTQVAAVRPAPDPATRPSTTPRLQPGSVFRDCDGAMVASSGPNLPPGASFCGPEMVVVPAGSFDMGANETTRKWYVSQGVNEKLAARLLDTEAPQHRVTIGAPIAVGRFEVTKGQFGAFVRESGHRGGEGCWVKDAKISKWGERVDKSWRDPNFTQSDSHPVVCVNWNDAQAYLLWLSRKTGQKYRLLSEAEWEYTARARTTTMRYWGDDPGNKLGCAYANATDKGSWSYGFDCRDGYKYTAPVGTLRANHFGLHDMAGNVSEWTDDCWQDSYRGAPSNGEAWTAGGCLFRVMRGRSWNGMPWEVRSANRYPETNINRDDNGFRIARAL